MMINNNSHAQCKPINLSTYETWYATGDNTKSSVLTKAGFKDLGPMIISNMGLTYSYGACWVDFKDGYARYMQQATWIPAHKALLLIVLNKDNYEALKIEIEKIAKYTGTENDGTRTYEGKKFFYTIQVVDFNEPLQKKHPSYSFGIAPL